MGASGRVFFLDPALGASHGHHAVVAGNYRRLLASKREVRFVGHRGGESEHPLFRHRLEDAFRVSRYGVAWIGDRRLARAAQWIAGMRRQGRGLPAAEGAGRAGAELSDARYRALFSGLGVGAALDRLQAHLNADDDVVCLGVDPAMLAALAPRRLPARLHLLFMYPDEEFLGPATRAAYWRLAGEVSASAAGVYAELEAHADVLRIKLQSDVAVQSTPVRIAQLAPRQSEDFTVAVLGAGRWDKAFDLLPAIVNATHALDAGIRFIIQAPAPNAGLDAPLNALRAMAGVMLLPSVLSDEAYEATLRDSALVLLAYDKERYRARGSGVLMDALIGGRPIVATEGTALASAIASGAGGAGRDPESFAAAIAGLRANYSTHLAAAAAEAARRLDVLRNGPLLRALEAGA